MIMVVNTRTPFNLLTGKVFLICQNLTHFRNPWFLSDFISEQRICTYLSVVSLQDSCLERKKYWSVLVLTAFSKGLLRNGGNLVKVICLPCIDRQEGYLPTVGTEKYEKQLLLYLISAIMCDVFRISGITSGFS